MEGDWQDQEGGREVSCSQCNDAGIIPEDNGRTIYIHRCSCSCADVGAKHDSHLAWTRIKDAAIENIRRHPTSQGVIFWQASLSMAMRNLTEVN